MKFKRIINTDFYEQESATASLVKIFLYSNTGVNNEISFDNSFVINNKKWIICFIKGDGQPSDIKTKTLDDLFKGNNYTGYLIWLDSYKSLDSSDYLQRHKFIALIKDKISDYQLYTEPKDGNTSKHILTFYGFDEQNIIVGNSDISFSKTESVKFAINSSETILNKLVLDIDAASESKGSFKLASQFSKAKASFINGKMSFISESRLTGSSNKESLLTIDLFDKDDLDNAQFSGTYYPFEQVYDSINDKYLSNFKISKPNLKTNFIDSLGSKYYSDFDNSDLSFCFSRVVDNRVSGGNDPQWDKYVLRPLGKLKLKTITNSKILLGSSGTETFKNAGNELEVFFKDSENIVVDEKNISLKKHNEKTRTSLLKITPLNYNLDSEKSPIFKNKSSADIEIKQIDYDSISFASVAVDEPLPIIPTLSFKDNPELFELEEVFKKIRLKAHQKVNKLNKSTNDVEYIESLEDYITPQGFQKNKSGYDFISNETESKFQFSLENIDTNLDLSLRKDQVFFVLTPALFKKYSDTVKNAKLNARFAINKDSSTGDKKIEFVVDLTSSYYPENPSSTTHSESIVLFKFHREKLSTLILDLKLWTNEGLLNDDLKAIQTAIVANKNFKDDYFTSILDDENWNGVLILNIPITDSKNLPKIFTGLSSSQDFFKKETDRVALETKLKFQYAAFPVNKTKIENGKIEIKSTSFYGLIDYNPFANANDYSSIKNHFKDGDVFSNNDPYKFVLSKLKVCFANSSIKLFESFAFIQIPNLFDDSIKFDKIDLANAGFPTNPDKKNNLIRLNGSYQKNSTGEGEISFTANSNVVISFDDNIVLKSVEVSKLGFNIIDKDKDEYRFDIDARVNFSDSITGIGQVFSFDRLDFQNVGLRFDLKTSSIPLPKFDLSKLLVFPKINFNGNGFLSSFPLKFSHFQNFRLPKIKVGSSFDFGEPDFDFFKIKYNKPILPGSFDWDTIDFGNLFSFIFDFDLGTLGNLGGLKDLKGQLLVGWSFKGGFALGFKLNGPSSKGIDINLFGALKLSIEELTWGKFQAVGTTECSAYFLRLNNAKLTIFGTKIPSDSTTFDGVIISDFRNSGLKKVAWLINLSDNDTSKLLLGLGQRSGPDLNIDISSTRTAIEASRKPFTVNLKDKPDCTITSADIGYQPDRNWFIASEDVMSLISKEWAKTIDVKFIFNDPKLYGIYLGFKGEFLKGFFIDILYKKLSDSLGVYSTEIQLPDALRNRELGGASLRLPNIGIEIYTNGDWKGDIGFPKNGNDWSRSGFIQLRTTPPFVGWFGFYLMQSKIASLTLFKGYISDEYSEKHLNIIQAGFAMRVGLGAYLNEGILYIGASISVYGVLEGAFAFKKENGLKVLFPDHFAVLGRVGAIAEIVGYVDFKIIKASLRISLRAEFGLLLVYLGESIEGKGKGIQPVKVYIEGEVVVAISVTLFCVKFFRKKWCLVVHLRFRAYVRFEYTIGGSGSSNKIAAKQQFKLTETTNLSPYEWKLESLRELPMVLIPSFTRRNESKIDKEETLLVCNFYIPFFGVNTKDAKLISSKENIFKDKIIQPFINDLITKVEGVVGNGKVTYENLREILLTSKLNGVDVNISLPKYRPKFIDGTNENDWNKLKKILEEDFFFKKYDDIDEFDEFKKSIEIEDCINLNSNTNNNKCPYRAIPAPISKSIIVNGNEVIEGFEIKIEELVSDLEDGKNEVKLKIDAIDEVNGKEIGEAYLNKLEAFFDAYKTQFIERNEKNEKLLDSPKIDIRENFIIPEFFKLAALLTLEKSYSKANPKEKKDESYNPFVKIANGNISFSTDNATWKEVATNDSIEELIGQLNYFYNSGLRLPKDESIANEDTISINSLIEQTKTIKPIDKAKRDWSKTKISIAGQDITSNIYGSGNDKKESVEGIWKFVDGFENTNGFDFDKLKNEFEPVKFIRPYKLINVTLGIQSNHKKVLNPDNSEYGRFYEIPKKLFKHGSLIRNEKADGSMFSFELTAAKYENSKGNSIKDEIFASSIISANNELELSKCLNIQIQVKQSVNKNESGGTGKVVLELNNVLADDLTLITLLKEEQFDVENISFYGKVENNGQTNLIKLTVVGSTIVKTNLSTRTAPPIFDTLNFKKEIESTLNQFIEDSNNPLDTGKRNFVRLVWEALTTNSGGYYLAFDNSTEFPKDLKEIVVSFESKQKEVPYFFNTLNVKQNKVVFDGLDKNELYLYVEQLNQDKEPVLEYHPTIPVHDFGFEVIKSISNKENYQQYLPLEFGLKKIKTDSEPEVEILNKDKVLPIMPSSPSKEDVNGKKEVIDNGNAVYSHISPLITDVEGKDIYNIHRYSTVGNDYKLKLGLRDIYGFRTNIDFDEKEYKHLYFDKLIPIDAWPLIKFSYWFKDFDKVSNSLHWTMKGYYDTREILDLAGIPKDVSNNYKYDFGKPISDADLKSINNVIEGVYNSLYTILAQLIDAGNSVSISNYSGTDGQNKIKDKIQSLIADIDSIFKDRKMPSKDSMKPIEFTLTTNGLKADEIESEIGFTISLSRNENTIQNALDSDYTSSDIPHLFKDLKSKASIWEYETVEKVSTRIQASNGDDGTSNLKSLNKSIRDGSKERFCLSISSNKNLERVLFLTNEEALKKLKIKQNYLESDGLTIKKAASYLGIKPISNKLWFGSYEFNSKTSEFSNIDLDKSLRIVLEKIDTLLDKGSISAKLKAINPTEETNHKALLEKLISAKKAISIKKLKEQIDWVIQEIEIDKTKAKDEFKEITLNKLTNFYAYDGIVSSEIENAVILKGHRISFSLDAQKNYNLISSKITDSGKWNIFFDQEESVKGDINFSVKPIITHIELGDFGQSEDDIKNSQWLQLIEPIKPILSSYNITKWNKIVREFPLKPVITKHEAIQSKMPQENVWSINPNTSLPDAGKWEYYLSIEDRYVGNDQLDVKLIIKDRKILKEDSKSFEGFISFWALGIKENTFKWEEFVEDISTLPFLNSTSLSKKESSNLSDAELLDETHFVLIKEEVEGQPSKWKIKTNLSGELKVEMVGGINQNESPKPDIKVTGFNIFSEKQKAFSILPILKVQRNFDVVNDLFKYETDEVEPPTPVTPMLRHYNALGIDKTDTFLEKVFKKNISKLPFKATAKYLVDIDSTFPKVNSKPLPIIPIKQVESEGILPTVTDEIFSKFDKANGYSAFSFTIYNRDDANSSLPIFYADTIFKLK
jgi:hypothetical protein